DHLRRGVHHRPRQDRVVRGVRTRLDPSRPPARRSAPRLLPAGRGGERPGTGPVLVSLPRRLRDLSVEVRGGPGVRGSGRHPRHLRLRAPLRAVLHAAAPGGRGV
ncbi:MAG: hypothetical protein AVDCRST_MAG32-2336, partial [uncultured Nocardioides sp.]